MRQRFMSLTTAALIIFGGAGLINGRSQTDSEARRVETIRSKVVKLGAGRKVHVKLLSNQMLSGSVDVVGDDQFTLIESPQRAALPIRYQQVKSIKKASSDDWREFGLLVGLVAGVIGLIALFLHEDR